jgi:hypothetical protein
MSPLPSPEERRRRLKSISLDDVLGRGRRGMQRQPEAHRKSSAADERERQRREASRRSRSGTLG